ncbi:MAG: RyR domain-containing protein [Chloroflexota bacterium]
MNGETKRFLSDFINTGRYIAWAEAAHESWRKTKESQGWKYGPARDNARKTNPALVDFADLRADTRGQSSLTPYAVVNFFRVTAGDKSLSELDELLAAILAGQNPELLSQLGEYVHSHFTAAQLAKGQTVETRDDLQVYEALDDETKSWDTQLALDMIGYLRQEISQ